MSGARRPRANRGRMLVGVAAVLLLLAAGYAAFGPRGQFSDQLEVRAVFATANQLKHGSDVRVAGRTVGTVDEVRVTEQSTALVTLRIDDALVRKLIRSDARMAIKPRLALEGNYYVAVTLGSPAAPRLRPGATIPRSQTSGPVQIDQLLNTFDGRVRRRLAGTVGELARGLGRPGATAPAGHAGVRRAARELDRALGPVARLARAGRGLEEGDLRRALGSTGELTSQLAEDPRALADVVTHFDTTFAALAADGPALSRTIAELDGLLRAAPSRLTAINAALPSLTRLGAALRPVLRRAPATLRDANRFLEQVDALVAQPSLPALLRRLKPVTANLPRLQSRLGELFPYLTQVTKCVSRNVVPTLNKSVQDGPNTTGQPIWQELLHLTASLASTASNSDGNGTSFRLGVSESENTLRALVPGLGSVLTSGDISGVSPTWLGSGVDPPLRPDQPCTSQTLPNLNTRYGSAPTLHPVPKKMTADNRKHTAALRSALVSRDKGNVLEALAPLLELLGQPTRAIEKQLGPLLERGR